MKILGICRKSIEDMEQMFPNPKAPVIFLTFPEVVNYKSQNPEEIIVVCDCLAKLLTIHQLKIVDAFYYNQTWIMKKDYNYNNIFNDYQEMDSLYLLYEHPIDYDLEEFSFVTHMTEFNKYGPFPFVKKIHNMLSRTKQETINCTDKYKELLKTLINKQMSDLYIQFINKEKGPKYPTIFKFIKFTLESDYQEKALIDAKRKADKESKA